MARFDFTKASDSVYFYGKVKKSGIEKPTAEYIAGGGNANRDQWTTEIEPKSYKSANGKNRMSSQNLPGNGQNPRESSGLMEQIKAYSALGFTINTEEDFKIIEGHTFHFENAVRKMGTGKRAAEKLADWPIALADDYVPPPEAELPVWGSADSNGASAVNSWELVASLLDGKPATTSEMAVTLSSGDTKLSSNEEIMTLVNMGQGNLISALIEKGYLTDEEGVLKAKVTE